MKTVLYPGSFDPLTNGHLDVIRRASAIFDKVIVATAVNSEKSPLFTIPERIELIRKACIGLNNVEAVTFDGLLVNALETFHANAVIRGLRALSDFEYEFQMALLNRDLKSTCETLFMMSSAEYCFVSSRLVKEVTHCGGDVSKLVPPCVTEAILKKVGKA